MLQNKIITMRISRDVADDCAVKKKEKLFT